MDVPGYLEGIAEERELRTSIYLGLPEIVCGQRIRNITPSDLAILTAFQNPFIVGGEPDFTDVAQFIWAQHVDYCKPVGTFLTWIGFPSRAYKVRGAISRQLSALSVKECIAEVYKFIDATFLDSPCGPGGKTIPIASDIAWMVYRFKREPFNQPKEVTMHSPLRELYQELRCDDKYNGRSLINRISDKARQEWLESMNTPELIAQRQKEDADRIAKEARK